LGEPKYWGKGVNTDKNEIIGVSQLLGDRCPGCPQILCLWVHAVSTNYIIHLEQRQI